LFGHKYVISLTHHSTFKLLSKHGRNYVLSRRQDPNFIFC
jgi:hypothetical protein